MVAYSTNEPFVLEQLGVPYLAFSPRASGIDFYSDNLVTSEKQIKTHPERVAALSRGKPSRLAVRTVAQGGNR